jgi:(p)ppGpp synthase/HD superfamily hydrolase
MVGMNAIASRVLMSMPLHAVTEMYGESGLRQRFAAEIADFDPAARATLSDALELAARLHAQDRRTREPYLNHPLRTAIRIICYYQVRDVDVLVAALLHDAVEDHPDLLAGPDAPDLTEADLTEAALAELARRYTPRVADLVRAVTNPAHEPGRDRFEQYREHVAESLEANPWARVIKVSDFTDNGVGLIHTDPSRHVRLATKYAPLVPVFRDLIARPDTPLSDDVKRHILGQLDSAEERFDAILEAA